MMLRGDVRRIGCSLIGCLLIVGSLARNLWGADPSADVPAFPRVPPVPVEHTAETFHTLHGFEMQLIAAEPLVADPVDVAYDEDGRAYVAEMRDYPYPEEKGAIPTEFPGRIRLLEDRDADGKFDHSSTFADGLSWPTSVVCWQGGVYVTAAPDLWYFRDADGDGRAEIRRRVYTGFNRDNVQAIVNGLRWGLDNRIYGAASGNGGQVGRADGKAGPPVVVTRHDFRFDPATGVFEAIPGGARFGNSFDDWGNRFVCNIRNPVQQVLVSENDLARNPLFAAPSAVHDVAESGDQISVFRRSPPEAWRVYRAQRWSQERVNYPRSELLGAGYWTSSSGVTVYRGSAYPEAFRGNVFVGEVAGNLVHRQILTPDGPTFRSQRGDAQAEFVASTDIWFRPVNFVNAPDGTLHVVDMYRETIEHPWSIPDDIKSKLDLLSGNDRGRIYRLAPPDFSVPAPPRLSRSTTAELVQLLEHPNGWHRETAQRLLYERQDQAAVPSLRQLFRQSHLPQARLHSLYALDGMKQLTSSDVQIALGDEHPQVRRHAVRLAEPWQDEEALRRGVEQRVEDPSPVVRFQVALSLGGRGDPEAARGLARLAARDADDLWIRAAVLSSAGKQPLAILRTLLPEGAREPRPGLPPIVRELTSFAAAQQREAAGEILTLASDLPESAESLQFAVAAGLGLGLERHQMNLASLTDEAGSARGAQWLQQIRAQARQAALDAGASSEQRLAALELSRFDDPQLARELLAECLAAREPVAVQLAAVRLLRLQPANEVARLLIERWSQSSAAARQEMIEALLSRAAWSEFLVAALETGEVAAGQLTIPQRSRLVGSAVPTIRERAVAVLGPAATTRRSEVVARYQGALQLAGDRQRGEAVFRRECLTCHRFGAAGHDVGPNLNTIRHRSGAEILVHLFDPNRDVPPQFINHTVQLKDGRVLTGVIASENDTSLELVRAENARDRIVRRDVEALVSSGQSLMPEGLEQKLSPQDVADLLAYVLGSE